MKGLKLKFGADSKSCFKLLPRAGPSCFLLFAPALVWQCSTSDVMSFQGEVICCPSPLMLLPCEVSVRNTKLLRILPHYRSMQLITGEVGFSSLGLGYLPSELLGLAMTPDAPGGRQGPCSRPSLCCHLQSHSCAERACFSHRPL